MIFLERMNKELRINSEKFSSLNFVFGQVCKKIKKALRNGSQENQKYTK